MVQTVQRASEKLYSLHEHYAIIAVKRYLVYILVRRAEKLCRFPVRLCLPVQLLGWALLPLLPANWLPRGFALEPLLLFLNWVFLESAQLSRAPFPRRRRAGPSVGPRHRALLRLQRAVWFSVWACGWGHRLLPSSLQARTPAWSCSRPVVDTEEVDVSRLSTEVMGEIDRTGGCALKYSGKEMSKMK